MEISFHLAKSSDAELLMKFIQEFYEYDQHNEPRCTNFWTKKR